MSTSTLPYCETSFAKSLTLLRSEMSNLGYMTLRVACLVSRPRSCPERVVAKSFRGDMFGSDVRMRWQMARPMPRFCLDVRFNELDVLRDGEIYSACYYDDFWGCHGAQCILDSAVSWSLALVC
jgi:hypothetical protein